MQDKEESKEIMTYNINKNKRKECRWREDKRREDRGGGKNNRGEYEVTREGRTMKREKNGRCSRRK
jgi:hypothetical protein